MLVASAILELLELPEKLVRFGVVLLVLEFLVASWPILSCFLFDLVSHVFRKVVVLSLSFEMVPHVSRSDTHSMSYG